MSCRACGGETSTSPCPVCGWPLDSPHLGPQEVGHVVKVSGGLLSKIGVSLPTRDPGSVFVLVKGTEAEPMSTDKFNALERVTFDCPSVNSSAGRLLAASLAADGKQFKAKWDNEVLIEAARASATIDVASRRGAVRDWLALGQDEHVKSLALSATEVTWCQALLAATDGDLPAVVDHLGRLPTEGYADRAMLLLSLVEGLLADDNLHERARALVEPFIQTRVDARALAAVLGPSTYTERLAAARALLASPAVNRSEAEDVLRLADGIDGNGPKKPLDPGRFPAVQALAVYKAGMAGAASDPDAEWLLPCGLPLYDDLVDHGSLTTEGLRRVRLQNQPFFYISARVDPSGLTDEQLQLVSHTSELARRAYIRRDARLLAKLPEQDPDVQHYAAMLARRNDGTVQRDQLRKPVREVLEHVDRYKEALKESGSAEPPEEMLTDSSCWWMVSDEAVHGRIRLSTIQRERAPAFAAWLDLCEIQSCIWAFDWTAARDLADRLLQRVSDERVEDEIRSMAAYAHFQLFNDGPAFDLLRQALEGRFTQNLVINASVVASELGSEVGIPMLVEVYNESRDPEVGINALRKGIRLWLVDEKADTLPAPLSSAIRNALARPQSDATLLDFVRFCCNHDREWLAGGPPISAGTSAQKDMVQFYETQARAGLPHTQEALDDVAAQLVEIHHRPPVPAWAAKELSELVDWLMDNVHVKFGEAAGLAKTIEVLLEGEVLSLPQGLVLGPQAGAHLAVSFKESDGSTLAQHAEQTFLFRPLEVYLNQKEMLPDGSREWVGEEMTRCLTVATNSLAIVTSNEMDEFVRAWNNLVEREHWDQQNRLSILRQERELLNQMKQSVSRCSYYEQQLRRLRFAMTEGQRQILTDIQHQIDQWNNELARLGSTL